MKEFVLFVVSQMKYWMRKVIFNEGENVGSGVVGQEVPGYLPSELHLLDQ